MAVETDPHVGIGTPITPAYATGLDVAEPLPYTLLSVHRYAQVMGINPVHFARGHAGDTVFPVDNRCANVWPRFSWQAADQVSHWDLAHEILRAERDLAEALGWWPAPRWVAQELRPFPRPYRPDVYRAGGGDARAQRAAVKARWAKVVSPGRRVVTPVGTASVGAGSLAYTDEDGDGFAETATVEVATALVDEREIKVYFAGTGGAQEWEVRPCRFKQVAGGNFAAVFPSWLFIDPELLSAYPTTAGFGAIDISTTANFVTSVDVYREQNAYMGADYPTAVFLWEPQPRNLSAIACTCGGVGCQACQYTTQDGCLHIRDADLGIVVPQPAQYDATSGVWTQVAYTCGRDPDLVRMYYYCGHQADRYLSGQTDDPLERTWAQAIAWMATARLERPFCNCPNLTALAKQLREDLARAGREVSYQLPFSLLECPFGTRRGEVEAWKRVLATREKVPSVALA